ncbi:MAG: tRNA (adenosine(37)-N6)-dimethylallyltransferase MiaA [Acutalibacteraceae bacterium]|nr:tRNA (adenosine(37)-N6)-dimethylallyltransferase MiaA [Acutalibacteraceae bacterium]
MNNELNTEKIPLIVVCGPTASGKTSLGIAIAKHFGGEIISADSMQIYKGMDIATAKPTKDEQQQIPHHLIDYVEPTTAYSVADYVKTAHQKIKEVYSKGKVPVLVGGTGLYIDSLVNNVEFTEADVDSELRENLYNRLQTEGADVLLNELAEFDEESAQRIGTSNHRRLIRAIEIYLTTGKTMTQHIRESKLVPSPYKAVYIALSCKDRQKLYDRINKRVDLMVEAGLIQEAEEFRKQEYSSTAVKAIGYKELEPFFTGDTTLEQALENLKRETRRYAKRQLTWFRRNENIKWLLTDELTTEEAINKAIDTINQSNILK